jgi:hypothetical protein
MKLTKLSILAVTAIALGFSSCSKECEVNPSAENNNAVSALKKPDTGISGPGAVLNNAQATLSFSKNPVSEGEDVTITAAHGPSDAGAIYVQENIGGIWTNLATNPYIITGTTAADNGREFRAYFSKAQGNDFYSTSAALSVEGACTVSLTPTTTMVSVDNNTYKFSTTYKIQACDRDLSNLKLQGGLTSGASFNGAASTPDFEQPKITGNGTNTVLTWKNINIPANTSKSFTVVYTKPINCGVTQTITGNWSASGVFADDNSPLQLGYNNQQTYTTPACSL